MIAQIFRSTLLSLGGGFLCQLGQEWLSTSYLTDFFRSNLINILVAILAVNSATMGIVLTKIRELNEKYERHNAFRRTRSQFLLSVKEQVALIAAAIILLTVSHSRYLAGVPNLPLLIDSAVCGIFIYAMLILYDMAKSVLIIVDYDPNAEI